MIKTEQGSRLSSPARATILAIMAFLAGVLNGLLGTGGGMILLFVLGMLLSGDRAKEAFVISSIGVLTFSAVSAVFYGQGGSLDAAALPRFALPAAVGGIAGALLLDKISTFWLKKLFAALMLYSGLKLLGVFG